MQLFTHNIVLCLKNKNNLLKKCLFKNIKVLLFNL